MKKIVFAALTAVFANLPAAASPQPFRYTANCYIGKVADQCVVIETREIGGALKSRNIFSNKMGLTIKMRWNGQKFIQTDSHNKFEYEWTYKPNPEIVENGVTATEVMPGVFTFVSWD